MIYEYINIATCSLFISATERILNFWKRRSVLDRDGTLFMIRIARLCNTRIMFNKYRAQLPR